MFSIRNCIGFNQQTRDKVTNAYRVDDQLVECLASSQGYSDLLTKVRRLSSRLRYKKKMWELRNLWGFFVGEQ